MLFGDDELNIYRPYNRVPYVVRQVLISFTVYPLIIGVSFRNDGNFSHHTAQDAIRERCSTKATELRHLIVSKSRRLPRERILSK